MQEEELSLCWTRICREPQRQHWHKRSAVEKREGKYMVKGRKGKWSAYIR
jgi:hypothetical protein